MINGDHPASQRSLADEHDQRRQRQELVGHRIEERTELGGVPQAPREPAVDLSVAMAAMNSAVAQYA
jgi:hypothetical protein